MRYEIISRPKAGYVYPKVISIDTEYSELNIRKARLLSIVVGVSPDLSYIIEDFKVIKHFIESADVIFAWNMTVDWYMLDKSGYPSPKGKWLDGMLMEHLIDERLSHSLGEFAKREYNDNYKEEFWSKYQSYQEAPTELAYDYEMRDGCYTYRACNAYLASLKGRMDLVEHVHRLQWALFDTEITGIKVNLPLMVKTKEEMGPQIEKLKQDLGVEFEDYCHVWELQKWKEVIDKLSSDKGKLNAKRPKFGFTDLQLQWLVYDMLDYPVIEKTKAKKPSTKTKVLKALNEFNPGLEKIIEYKSLKSAYPTFVVGLLDRVQDGRIYPTFYVNGTDTGRISSSDPNMQNMPSQGVFRNFILPETGDLIIGADYEGIEVAVEANLTLDPNLLKIMLEGASKHDLTAEAVGISRKEAKTLNFLLQYGGGVWKIQKTFNVSKETAQEMYDKYWESYSGVKEYKQRVVKELQEKQAVTNIFGRTRHFEKPTNSYEVGKQERQAYSHMVQGPAADMNNAATYLIHAYLSENKIGRLMMPIHDEIVCSVRRDLVEEAKLGIVQQMESVNDRLSFKYRIKAKPYGGFEFWQKA